MGTTTTEVVDDGRRPDRLGRVRTPQARREELLTEYERSGMSQAAFARRAGVRYPTFAHWVQERRREQACAPESPASATARFVELRVPAGTTGRVSSPTRPAELSVTLPCGSVLRGSEPSALAALARALLVRA